MKIRIISLLLVLWAFQACEKDINFKEFGQEPRLCVFGLSGASDMTVVRLFPTNVLGNSQSEGVSVEGARVSLTVNGTEVALSPADELPVGSYCANRPLSPGDKLEFRASVEGLEPVEARCAVPAVFPEYSVGMEKIRGTWNGDDSYEIATRLGVTVEFEDDPDTDDYYGMQVYRCREMYSYSNVREYEYLEPVTYSYSGIYDFSLSDVPMVMHYALGTDIYSSEYAPMLVVDDGSFVGGKGRMEFLTLYRDDSSDRRFLYKIFLYRLSPELYRFVKAGAIASTGMPILLMMAPPAYAYTNVRGGAGVFGSLTCTETDWLPNISD